MPPRPPAKAGADAHFCAVKTYSAVLLQKLKFSEPFFNTVSLYQEAAYPRLCMINSNITMKYNPEENMALTLPLLENDSAVGL
jgi:hypothetical protein